MLRSFLSMLVVTSLAVALSGCGGTYVNIPPEPGDVAAHDPNNAGVRKAVIQALQTVIKDLPASGQIAIAMPKGTTPLTQAAVINQLGSRAVLADSKAKGAIHLEVEGVRIRGTEAAVDIARPSVTGGRELVTVSMGWKPFNGWQVTNVQVWHNVPMDNPLASAHPATQPSTQPTTQPSGK